MLNKLKFINFGASQEHYEVVILVKEDSLSKDELIKYYIDPIIKERPSLSYSDFVALNLDFDGKKTAKVNATIKPWLDYLGSTINCKLILVADSSYYKIMSGEKKTTHAYGSVVECTYHSLIGMKVALTLGYRTVFYDTKNQDKITLTNRAISAELNGNKLFEDVVHYSEFPKTFKDIRLFLKSLFQYPVLSCDIEAFSLEHTKAGIGTISFAWNKHEGGAFCVDYRATAQSIDDGVTYGLCNKNDTIHHYLAEFFYHYLVVLKHKILWHNISYDVKVLIWELLMKADHTNKLGMLEGLEIFTNNDSFEDTKIIAYVATNSCAGNELGLKTLALPFAGNYALEADDIKDITKVPVDTLLTYNLIDCLSTWYVYDTYYPILLADDQLTVYEEVFKPSVKVLMQAELHGMPIDQKKVLIAEKILSDIVDSCHKRILKNPYVELFIKVQSANLFHELHEKWKKKTAPIEDKAFDFEFNMNSSPQLIKLLHTMLELPVIDLTDTKLPSMGTKALEKIRNHTQDPLIHEIIDIIIEFNGAIKVLTSFIPAFKNAYVCPKTGVSYLIGNFNIGGTVSGRLSCSKPNLQQIPSGSTYAKIIKDCFIAPKGYLMVGLDFNSLEDYISALTTKDPNKLKVYLGHTIYEIMLDGVCHHIRDDATICYDGNNYTGEQFYALYGNS